MDRMLLVIVVLIGELLYNIHVDLDFHRTTIKQLRGTLLLFQKLTFQTLHLLSVRHWVFLIMFNKVLMN